MKHLILPAAAAALLALASAPALAAETIKVTLADDNGAAAMPDKNGMNMGGDMSTSDMHIAVSSPSVAHGTVVFDVSNGSTSFVHEMLVVKLADPGKPLPFDAVANKLSEATLGSLGEVAELDPGKSGTLQLDLAPGTYALVCNQPGHYMAGMWTLLNVT